MTRGMPSEVLLLHSPAGLDGIEVGRIRRQVHDTDTVCPAGGCDPGVMVRGQIVHHDNVARREAREQLGLEPRDEAGPVRGLEHRGEDDPTRQPDRAKEGEIGAPVHGDAIDELSAPLHPGMASPHGQIEARFVEEDELLDRNAKDPSSKRPPLRYDVGPLTLQRPASFFLMTYPYRWSARFMLET